MTTFEKQIEELINRYSKDSECETADYILAVYLIDCMAAFAKAVKLRDHHNRIES